MSAPLNMPLSNDLIRYSWESKVNVRSQLIQGRALVEATGSSANCAFYDNRKSTEKMDSTVIANIAVFNIHIAVINIHIAVINIHIAVFSRLDNILK